jgi:type IV pilus assembly protein PilB
VLRQAPNIILVGEMRDSETAEMGIQASLTGHLVFSTLHTNDAPSAITRLVDMGVPPYLVASSILAVLAQRLVRVVCAKCKTPFKPSKTLLEPAGITPEMAKNGNFVKGKGCGHCQKTGYRGRLGIYELMVMTPKLRQMAFDAAATQEIRKVAIAEGMDTLYSDGIKKVLNGVTTLEEVFRVAKQTEQERQAA